MNRNSIYKIVSLVFILTSGIEMFSHAKLSKEELLFLDVPIVVTASKKEQFLTEAPATVTIITAEDIRQSGFTTIPDILRSKTSPIYLLHDEIKQCGSLRTRLRLKQT